MSDLSRVKVGDLVRLTTTRDNSFLGLVMAMRPMENHFRDSVGIEQVYTCLVYWNQPAPVWLEGKQITETTDGLLEAVG